MKGASFLLLMGLMTATAPALAGEQTQTIVGTGLDGKPCEAQIVRDGSSLKKVTLTGAAREFEILADTNSGYRPTREIIPNGGAQVFELLNEDPELYQYFELKPSFLNDEKFELNTADIPASHGQRLRMVATLKMNYANDKLVEVEASAKMQVDVLPIPDPIPSVSLGSKKFVCKAN